MGKEQITKLEGTINELNIDIANLKERSLGVIELDDIRKKYKLPILSTTKSSATPVSLPYKTYISSTGHTILVGKGPKENDELTKSARSNDYWLHATGVSAHML